MFTTSHGHHKPLIFVFSTFIPCFVPPRHSSSSPFIFSFLNSPYISLPHYRLAFMTSHGQHPHHRNHKPFDSHSSSFFHPLFRLFLTVPLFCSGSRTSLSLQTGWRRLPTIPTYIAITTSLSRSISPLFSVSPFSFSLFIYIHTSPYISFSLTDWLACITNHIHLHRHNHKPYSFHSSSFLSIPIFVLHLPVHLHP